MKDKFVGKYMRQAKLVGEDKNPCHSRKIGVLVVDPVSNKILGTGYNGPPRGTPHCDDPEYLKEIFWPQLTAEEKDRAVRSTLIDQQSGTLKCGLHTVGLSDEQQCDLVTTTYAKCKVCPRKIVGAASGKRLELCSCAHAETNAIVNSSDDLYGSYMFCWCGVPCYECTKLIVNAGIKKVYVIDWGMDYSHGSRWLFRKAGVEIVEHPPEYYLNLDE